MSKMGKTISVTIPLPLVEELQEAANKVGISRSRFISNLLLKWQEVQKNPPGISKQEQTTFETRSNKCSNREDDGFCISFGRVCNAPQSEALKCISYVPKKERSNI